MKAELAEDCFTPNSSLVCKQLFIYEGLSKTAMRAAGLYAVVAYKTHWSGGEGGQPNGKSADVSPPKPKSLERESRGTPPLPSRGSLHQGCQSAAGQEAVPPAALVSCWSPFPLGNECLFGIFAW